MADSKPVTTLKLRKMKEEGTPIVMVTAYDYPSAMLAEEAGADMILVGDSLGNVVLGYDSTIPVTLNDMIHHSRAVNRGAKRAFVVTDLPFLTYHGSLDTTIANVARVMQEGGSKAVKMEGGREIATAVDAIVKAGVPVIGHVGLTPQSVHMLGGYRVQGKNDAQVAKLKDDVRALEQAGATAIVLELVTDELAAEITRDLSIPTIGIGSGAGCDGQVLVFHDLLQYEAHPVSKRFVKTYANIGQDIRSALSAYAQDVRTREFPAPEHAFKAAKPGQEKQGNAQVSGQAAAQADAHEDAGVLYGAGK
ncbi:3-methyl-2-oxobutanoate hydroxymethyltransferase [Gorillibacterium timonense]|uniref:3-methyl-2-oxobutanoate hydroxymethyltransferase n=1 Tax=Gorillibacterium timonense TaxID=1689269 RepID=UPI00071E283D|nr:3-methyl-2-oxobutanoate hydroxymethyltransferase [Gorillibacterium timonense]